jgi:hypothetical protein
MSDTPRTDALEDQYFENRNHVSEVFLHAQQLERELVEAREQLRLCNVDQLTTAAELAEANRNYMELIMSVGNKYLNETRHETAKRYIQERENTPIHGPYSAIKEKK